MNKTNIKVLTLSVALIAFTSLVSAAEMKEMSMSPEQQATQARMKEYFTPNANHDVLKALEGSWNAEVKFWMDPASEPQVSQGTAESEVIMGGKFVEQYFNGSMMGQPFEGRALWGYDNMKKAYQGIWFDSFATGIMESTAQYDATAKTLTEEGTMSCPVTQETHRWYKAVTTFIDADHYTYESYMKDKEGKEFKGMMITYSRVK